MKYSYSEESALVLVSGGQDSITSLYWAKREFARIYAISFFYGQKHRDELKIAEELCRKAGVAEHRNVDISFLSELVESNLFAGTSDVNESHQYNEKIPASFVPYRNMIFLTLAAAWASKLGVRHIVSGVCETDYSGYADCRDVFIKSLQASLGLATDFGEREPVLHTPLMWLSKAEEFRMAEEMDILDIIISDTLTCYNGIKEMHDYGMGCGNCPACKLRRKGFEEYKKRYAR